MFKTKIGFEAVDRNQVIHDLAILKLLKDPLITSDMTDDDLLHAYYENLADLDISYKERYSK